MRALVLLPLAALGCTGVPARTQPASPARDDPPALRFAAPLADSFAPRGAFLPDGRWLATEPGGAIVLYDGATGRRERAFVLPGLGAVDEIAVEPDGKRVAIVDTDRTLHVVDLTTSEQVAAAKLAGHARFLPDGTLLTLEDYELLERDPATLAVRFTYEAAEAYAFGNFLVAADGKTIVATATRGNAGIAIWQRGIAAPRYTNVVPGGSYAAIALDPTGTSMIVRDRDDGARRFALADGKLVVAYPTPDWSPTVATFSPRGERIVLADATHAQIFDASTGALRVALPQGFGGGVALSPGDDGRTLALAGVLADRPRSLVQPTLWDAATGRRLDDPATAPRALAFSADGTHLAIPTHDGAVELALTANTPEARRIGSGPVLTLAYAATGALFELHPNGRAELGGVRELEVPDTAIWAGPLLADAIAFGDPYPTVGLAGDAHPITVFSDARVPSYATAAASARGLAFTDDKTVEWWSAGQDVLELGASDAMLSAVAVSPDAREVASGDEDGRIVRWSVGAQHALGVIETGRAPIAALAYAPDGALLAASTAGDPRIALYATTTGARLGMLAGATAEATAIAFSPDGALVAAASRDTGVRVWRVATGALLVAIRATGTAWAATSPDGRFAASSPQAATLFAHAPRRLDARTPALVARALREPGRGTLADPRAAPDATPATCLAADAGELGYLAARGTHVMACVGGARRTCWDLDAATGAIAPLPVPPAFAASLAAQHPPALVDPSAPPARYVATRDDVGVDVIDTRTNTLAFQLPTAQDSALGNGTGTQIAVLDHTLVTYAAACAGPCSITNLYDIPTGKRVIEQLELYNDGIVASHARGELWWFEGLNEDASSASAYYDLVDVAAGKVIRTVAAPAGAIATTAGLVLLPHAAVSEPFAVVDDRGTTLRRIQLPTCP